MESIQTHYPAAYQEFKRREKYLFAIFFGFVPYCIISMLVWTELFGMNINLAWVLIVPYYLLYMGTGVYFAKFKCPNCGAQFSMTGGFASFNLRLYREKCQKCNLKLTLPESDFS